MGNKGFSAAQVLGKPNAYPTYGISLVAWRPAPGKRTQEFVQVAFERPVSGIQQIAVFETYQVGAISRLVLIDPQGKEYVVFNNPTTKGDRVPQAFINRLFIPPTPYAVAQLRLELNTAGFPDNPQIDAIGISTSREPIEAVINVARYAQPPGKPQNLGTNINTEYDDMLPIISPDGNTLYFARKKAPQNIGPAKNDDIYMSTKDVMGRWGPAVHLGPPLNDENHNFVCTVSPDGNTLIVANMYTKGGGDGVSISYRRSGQWSKPVPLPIKNMYNRSEFACYHMGVDGKTLVMAIERDDTYGDMDLYVSFQLPDGSWSEPMNLGPTINTAAAEASVFLAADGRTIYFSSMGHPGYGEFDMYMSRRLDNTWRNWTEPLNLGYPFNTPKSDYYYTIPASGDYAYYSSNDNSYGKSDIFRIPLPPEIRPEPVAMIKANVVAQAPSQPLPQGKQPASAPPPSQTTLVVPKDDPGALVKNFPGYYPIEKPSSGTPVIIQEEDDARNQQAVKVTPQQAQLNQLQERLQQLKQEQAMVQQQIEQQHTRTEGGAPQATQPASVQPLQVQPPAPGPAVSDLDTKLAELRSQMELMKTNPSAFKTQPSTPPVTQPATTYTSPAQSPSSQSHTQQLHALPYEQRLEQYQQSYQQPTYPQQPQRIYYVPQPQPTRPYQEPAMPDKFNNANATLEELRAMRDAATTTAPPVKTSKIKVDTNDPNIKYEPAETPVAPQPASPELKSYEEKLKRLRESMPGNATTTAEPVRIIPDPVLSDSVVAPQIVKTDTAIVAPISATAVPSPAIAELAENKDRLEEATRALDEEKQLLEQQRREMEALIASMEAERDRLEAERRKMQEETQRLQQQKEQQAREVAQLEKQIEQMAKKNLKTQAELQKAKQDALAYEERSEDIILMPIEEGAVIQVNNIYFNANATFLKPESYRELNKVAAFLKSNPNIKVEIGGHTNGLCDDDFCLYLSNGRARAVRDYIISQGVQASRVTFKGYGKQFPIADNKTAEGRLRNQRVEMKIIEVN